MKPIVGICLILACTFSCAAQTIIVAKDGSGNFTTIQAAIDFASYGDTVKVKQGTYNESIRFKGKGITLTSVDPNNSSVVQSTIISSNANSSVAFDFGEDSSSVLVGFTIMSKGILCNSSSPTILKNVIQNCTGAGIVGYNSSSPTICYNIIENNSNYGIVGCHGLISYNQISGNTSTGLYGGGLYQCNGEISNNVISTNTAVSAGGGLADCQGLISRNQIVGNMVVATINNWTSASGGGIANCSGTITDNLICGNSVKGKTFVCGGGIAGGGTIKNNLISGNIVYGNSGSMGRAIGGGIAGCIGPIVNNVICGNNCTMVTYAPQGGGIYDCNTIIKNNIIAYNNAYAGAAIYGASKNSYNDFWNNGEYGADAFGGDNVSGYSSPGYGDILVNPVFFVEGYWDLDGIWHDGDYHLKSTAGRWNAQRAMWVTDTITSPCVDSGDPCDSIFLEPNPNGGRINMGNYGGTAEASKSPSGIISPICQTYPQMDFNKDCKVDFKDFALFASHWLECNLDPPSACGQ